METVYTYCAIIGGVLFCTQFLFSLFGFGEHGLDGVGDVDVDLDTDIDAGGDHGFGHNDGWFVGMFSLKAIMAAGAVFGLAGQAAAVRLNPFNTLMAAFAAAVGTMFAIGWVIRQMHKLNSDGTVRIEESIGTRGTVYLTVPKSKSATGKVTVNIQGRTMEYEAMTASEELPSGTPIVVVDVLTPKTIEVARADQPAELAAS